MVIVIYVIEILILLALIYGFYKIVWYTVKMLIFTQFAKKLIKKGADVEKQRGIFGTIFGKKGLPDFIVKYKDKKYEISVLSFVSTHGRWNIEKTRTRFFIESRRASKVFYKKHVNSSLPDHVAEYKGEGRISRKELNITPIDPSFEKQIFLLYPYPKRITYTDAHYNELYVGDKVEGHFIMDVKSLNNLLFNEG